MLLAYMVHQPMLESYASADALAFDTVLDAELIPVVPLIACTFS
jgi:hypothetical protein